jgi:MSHA biogenesis protein MshP
MPLALFIVLGLGAMAMAISRMSSNSYSSSIHDGLSVQALYAAESAAQYAMNQLLFNAASSAEVDARCTAVEGQTVNFSTNGLGACQAQLSCAKTTITLGTQVYEVISNGQCGSGTLMAERTLLASVTFD